MTPDQVKRKLAAILSADVQGYSRLMEEDEEGTICILKAYMEVISEFIPQHRGRVVATGGDSVLAEFASVVDGVRCAVGIQEELKERNKDVADNRRMEFRIGVNLGDVVEEGDTILGDGVNIAARLESLSEAGGICISGTAFDQVENKLSLGYEYLGEQTVKNIAKPVRVYRVLMEPEAAGRLIGEKKAKTRQWQKKTFIAVAILIFVIAAGVALWQFYLLPTPQRVEVASKDKMAFPLPDKPSIAVLPFVNMSGDPKQEFFSDGITEDIITALSRNPNLFVIARNSTFTYKGKPVKVKQVSEELGVRYVLEGSVQKSGDRVRITAQLIDALNGNHLWSERYDRELKDLFALQDEITLKVLMGTQVKMTGGENAWSEKHFRGKQGLESYLKTIEGYYYLVLLSVEGNNKARRIAEEIVTKWPENPDGYIILGWVCWMDVFLGSTKSPRESLEKAMELAQKALAIDDSLSASHGLLVNIYMSKREYDKAIAEAERTLVLDPNGSFNNETYARALYAAQRFNEAIPIYQKAIRLNPLGSSIAFANLGACYRRTGRFEEAVSAYKQAILLSPNNILAHISLASIYILTGREKEARAEAAEVLRLNPKFSLDNYSKATAYNYPVQSSLDNFIESLRKAGLK